MISIESAAFFFGASPLASAFLLSLGVTLLLLVVFRADLILGQHLRKWLPSLTGPGSRTRKLSTLLGACLLLMCFLALAVSVLMTGFIDSTPLGVWDRTFVTTAHHYVQPGELAFFGFVTELAGRAASIILGFGLGIYLLVRRKKRHLAIWSIGLIGNSIIIQLIKQYFHRPRPEFLNPFLTEANFSFPSGHASGAVVMFGLVGYLFLISNRDLELWKQFTVVASVLWLGVFIGTSRLVLGVHYPTDVLTGWLVACTWLSIIFLVDRYMRGSRD